MFKALVLLPILISVNTPSQRNLGTIDNVIIKTQERVQIVVPYVHQIDNLTETNKPIMRTSACGPSALTMVLNYLGEDYDLNEVISNLPNEVYIKGDRFYNLPAGANVFGLKSVSFKNSPKNIYEELVKGNPVILNIQNYDGITGHAVVVTGMKGFDGENAEALIVHDPYVGPYRVFEYLDNNTLIQPEGYYLPIGILDPFYLTK